MEHTATGAECLHSDVLRRCLGHLSHSDLVQASSVSREWHAVARCESLWQSRYADDFRHSQAMAGSRSGGSNLGCPAARLFPEAAPAPPAALPGSEGWRRMYQERTELEDNWGRGQCSWVRLEGHRDYIRCAQLAPGGASLATCSGSFMHRDCSIRLWDVASGACLEHMEGHVGPIWSLQYDGRRVASCDDEGAVRLWDTASHRVGVSSPLGDCSLKCLSMDEEQLVVGGESGQLALWHLPAMQRAMEAADGVPQPMGEQGEEEGDEPRLPSWQAVPLEQGAAGVRPSLGRTPQRSPALSPDISCVQVDAGLCAAGESGQHSASVHLWSTAGGEMEHRGELSGHVKGVSTLSFQVCLPACLMMSASVRQPACLPACRSSCRLQCLPVILRACSAL